MADDILSPEDSQILTAAMLEAAAQEDHAAVRALAELARAPQRIREIVGGDNIPENSPESKSPGERREQYVLDVSAVRAAPERYCMEGENRGMPGVCPGQQPQGRQATLPDHSHALPGNTSRFRTPSRVREIRSSLSATNRHLTSEQRQALTQYTSTESDNYEKINGALKSGESKDRGVTATINALSKAIAEAPVLREPVLTYRAIQVAPKDLVATLDRYRTAAISGVPVRFDGFTSTSTSTNYADDFYHEDPSRKGVIFEIEAIHGLQVPEDIARANDNSPDEFILDHGSMFEVLGVQEVPFDANGTTRRVVRLRQVVGGSSGGAPDAAKRLSVPPVRTPVAQDRTPRPDGAKAAVPDSTVPGGYHAGKGGTTIAGMFYGEGEVIPDSMMRLATPAEKAGVVKAGSN